MTDQRHRSSSQKSTRTAWNEGERIRAVNAKAEAGQDQIERVFGRVAPWVLASMDLGWPVFEHVGPGVRIEVVRVLHRLGPEAWVERMFNSVFKVESDWDRAGMKAAVNRLGNWRCANTMNEVMSSDPRQGLGGRAFLRDLLCALPTPVDLPWILFGTGIPEGLETLEQRVRWTLAVLRGQPDIKKGAVIDLPLDAWCRELGLSGMGVFTDPQQVKARRAGIAAIAKVVEPWCSSRWLRTGQSRSPQILAPFLAEIRAIGAVSAWEQLGREHIPVSLERRDIVALQRVVRGKAAEIHNRVHSALTQALMSDVPGLPPGLANQDVSTADAFLRCAKRIEQRFVVPMKHQIMAFRRGRPMPNKAWRPVERLGWDPVEDALWKRNLDAAGVSKPPVQSAVKLQKKPPLKRLSSRWPPVRG